VIRVVFLYGVDVLTQKICLYSTAVCPFAQRVRMMLAIKNVDHDVVSIDLDNKPAGFNKISPHGKVPLLKLGEHSLWESGVILEYLEDQFPTPPLLGQKPFQRAMMRLWISDCGSTLIPSFFAVLKNKDPELSEEKKEMFYACLYRLEHELLAIHSGQGPYFFGEKPSLVDICFYPFFERLPVLTHYRDVSLTSDYNRLNQWLRAMQELPAVKATQNTRTFYIKHYEKFTH
jgi:glutathione S-transferase